ncbi:alpha/beta hydrolase family protein [Galbibacter sp.]|jgi:pimeloyl-ACP methyl ester carboxylesterase|uniref:alpha/beta hydrolase family protein n=1 Tax=Galbibacter sp. TaxID=2918471 RepID=UPI003A8D3792
MHTRRNQILQGEHQKPILYDIYFEQQTTNAPLVIFCHGYKGFKDWGYWDLVAKAFAKNGICFVKFNFSHNGGTINEPIDFPDLEAFATNNFTIELDDLKVMIDHCTGPDFLYHESIDTNSLSLIGHSRGGGIVYIKAAEDERVKKVVSWASVSDFEARFADEKARAYWKERGVIYVENSRTKQQLPHYYQFYEDFVNNTERFTIENAVQNLKIPNLVIHGTEDPTVAIAEGEKIKQWSSKGEFLVIEGANHVFGGKHPWESEKLPQHMQEVVEASIGFVLE